MIDSNNPPPKGNLDSTWEESHSGFTLIELLIVMVIISIIAGIAVITLGANSHKQYEMLAKQLINSMQLAEEEAMLRPATLGFAFTPKTFTFYTIAQDEKTHANKWLPIYKSALRPHALPGNIQITLRINKEIIPANGIPKLIIPPSNDLTPFVIFIGKPGEKPYYQIIGKANGEVRSEIFQAE